MTGPVERGGLYVARVNSRATLVRILRKSKRYAGGWDAVNEATGRNVYVSSARKLRPVAEGERWVLPRGKGKAVWGTPECGVS